MRDEKGFTLIEAMIVIAIIGILAAIAVPKFQKMLDMKKAQDQARLSGVVVKTDAYSVNNTGTSPKTDVDKPTGTTYTVSLFIGSGELDYNDVTEYRPDGSDLVFNSITDGHVEYHGSYRVTVNK